jgi:hypothetical protein
MVTARNFSSSNDYSTFPQLRRFPRDEPPWCKRAGRNAWIGLVMQRPDPVKIDAMLKAYGRALAWRDYRRQFAEFERRTIAFGRGDRATLP